MPWIPRGLSEGVLTSRYPRRADGYGPAFRASISVIAPAEASTHIEGGAEGCPTGAITILDDQPQIDRGKCILCGRCTELRPDVFRFDPGFETAGLLREALVVPQIAENDEALRLARAELGRRARALRKSVHIRHIDVGSDGSEEWEVAALTNPVYDVHRLGIFFTASPRHADLLLATGVGAAGMLDALKQTYQAMPEPKIVIAAGVDAISGGLLGRGYASQGGLATTVPVDVFVPGSPPSPFGLLYGILLALGQLSTADRNPRYRSWEPSDKYPGVADPGPRSEEFGDEGRT